MLLNYLCDKRGGMKMTRLIYRRSDETLEKAEQKPKLQSSFNTLSSSPLMDEDVNPDGSRQYSFRSSLRTPAE